MQTEQVEQEREMENKKENIIRERKRKQQRVNKERKKKAIAKKKKFGREIKKNYEKPKLGKLLE